jgi:predicted secreted protein
MLGQLRRVTTPVATAVSTFGMVVGACAGDTAELNILGFSQDGRIFAFEEYGVQDGSGFPYANRFYIDTENDSFLTDTPVRIRLDDENATVSSARRQARERGEKIIADSTLAEFNGILAAFNAVTELSADPHRVVATPRPVFPPIDAPLEFRLEELPIASEEPCKGLGEIKGFRLTRIDTAPGGETRILHEDKDIPQSRGCPIGYRLGGVQVFHPEAGPAVFAVLIAVEGIGFEGPDYRWMAVTGRL